MKHLLKRNNKEIFAHLHDKQTECCTFNPIWTGLFANLRKLGRQNGPPPNLAVSSQMTMKLGKGILWVEIFEN